MTGVVIVRERCASKEPPADSDARMTNIGVAYYVRDHRGEAWFYIEDDHATMPCDPQPRVWFDFPRDADSRFTVEDLDDLAYHVLMQSDPMYWEAERAIAARLREALDALNKEDS